MSYVFDSKIIINLPHIILYKINCYLDNIDRVCFSLVCKRWFTEKDGFLLFQSDYGFQGVENFYLQSFRSVMLKSIDSVPKRFRLNVSENSPICDLHLNLHWKDVPNMKVFRIDVDQVAFLSEPQSPNSKQLFTLMLESSVTKIVDCPTVAHGLPRKLKILEMDTHFNMPLEPGCLPETLEVLSLGSNFNHDLKPGVLPKSLKKLTFGNSFDRSIAVGVLPEGLEKLVFGMDFDQLLVPGSLPSSLQTIRFNSLYQQELLDGALPQNLLNLKFIGCLIMGSKVVPQSLTTLKFVPSTWIPLLKLLPNLRSLLLEEVEESDAPINLSDIPSGLAKLSFKYTKYRLFSAVSPLLKVLNIGSCKYDMDDLFPSGNTYHFDKLSIGRNPSKPISRPNLNIKLLKINGEFSIRADLPLPENIESMCFHGFYDQKIECPLPSMLKHLTFSNNSAINNIGIIPEGVETVNMQQFLLNNSLLPNVLPKSVRSISTEFATEGLDSFPNTVTNIEIVPPIYLISNTLQIRKLDDNYFVMVGQIENYNFIGLIFHKSTTYKSIFDTLKAMN